MHDDEPQAHDNAPLKSPPVSPPVAKDEPRLVPAPPPKENVWAKRKEQLTGTSAPPAGQTATETPKAKVRFKICARLA